MRDISNEYKTFSNRIEKRLGSGIAFYIIALVIALPFISELAKGSNLSGLIAIAIVLIGLGYSLSLIRKNLKESRVFRNRLTNKNE